MYDKTTLVLSCLTCAVAGFNIGFCWAKIRQLSRLIRRTDPK
jgi:hypothetical protein